MSTRMPPRSAPTAESRPQSVARLPPGPWTTVLDCLCERFHHIPRVTWESRMARGLVRGEDGSTLTPATPHRAGLVVRYCREVEDEPRIPHEESVLHVDENLIVADKPPFLPVTPAGPWVLETLQARLMRRLGLNSLVPLHRIDRATSGLVLFSANPGTRARYQSLFRERRIVKTYEALAPPLLGRDFPLTYRSRLMPGEPFFRVREEPGPENSETSIRIIERSGLLWRYELVPLTGRKHQLRAHLAALGAPILNDPYYPELAPVAPDDYRRPLALLARSLEFEDPLSGRVRFFATGRKLPAPSTSA